MDRREVLAALAPLSAKPQGTSELRVTLSTTWGEPFVVRQRGRPPQGILPELMQALAAEMKLTLRWVELPSLRTPAAMSKGEVDLHCLIHPDWWGEPVEPQRWSAPVVVMRDLLVAAPGGPADWAAYQAQSRWRIGTVHGYLYPTLQADMARGRLLRDDAPNQATLLAKLSRARTPLGIVSEYALAAHNRSQPEPLRLRALGVVHEVETRCLVAERPGPGQAAILAAIERLHRSGRWSALLKRHQG
ncbi:polar amino acid transport system substrate-binding protein [Inhella inkyongensis]|uniref:Polar amino acid transport system substrate-binding protein n=1 Tax=Inhella inkyongensis TaxID=392593 RepID=A0A840S7P0_9BURK|nr:ABC transporter substrate-binding protein [Inhella inkyongensis]MBB5204804.1 polar amino acid transport system substrate-binding protein [Inhella inkyongensis]